MSKEIATAKIQDVVSDALDAGLESWEIHDIIDEYLGENDR